MSDAQVNDETDPEALGEHEFERLCRNLLRRLGAGAGGRVVAVSAAHQAPSSTLAWCRVARAVAKRLPTTLGADLLATLLRTSDAAVVEAAARALVAIAPDVGKERALSALAPLAASAEPAVARIAVSALGEVGHPQAIEVLTRASRSRDRATRYAAYAALARIDDPKARQFLVSRLGLLSPRKWEVLAALLYPGAWCINVPPRALLGPSWGGLGGTSGMGCPAPAAACRWMRQVLGRPSQEGR